MPLFPVFLDLSEQMVLVVGTGAEADRKARLLELYCGAVERTAYPPTWSKKPALAVLAQKDHPDNEVLAAEFAAQGIPVNVCDRPELCDFRFPALIRHGEVSVGIATGGKAPVLASLLRERLEEALPQDLEAVAETAAELTKKLRQTVPDPKERTALLRRLLRELL